MYLVDPSFALDPRLATEALAEIDLPLCRLLLRNERRFPWVVLVPRRAGVQESFALSEPDRATLWEEVDRVAAGLLAVTRYEKINIAAFGNVVPQLHIHVVARRDSDPAWPGAAVGWDAPSPYGEGVPAFWSALKDVALRS